MKAIIAVLAVCAFASLIFLLVVNGFYMLVSPAAWYRLPRWLRANGNLKEEQYGRGWGAVQVRILGAILLATIALCALNYFSQS